MIPCWPGVSSERRQFLYVVAASSGQGHLVIRLETLHPQLPQLSFHADAGPAPLIEHVHQHQTRRVHQPEMMLVMVSINNIITCPSPAPPSPSPHDHHSPAVIH